MTKCTKCGTETGEDWKKLCENCFSNEKSDLILKRQLLEKAIDFYTERQVSFKDIMSDEYTENIFKLSDKWFEEAKKRGY